MKSLQKISHLTKDSCSTVRTISICLAVIIRLLIISAIDKPLSPSFIS